MSQPQPRTLRLIQIFQYILLSGFILYSVFFFFILFTETTFKDLQGLALDKQDNYYVVEAGTFSIKKFDSQGKSLASWGSKGNGDGQFGERLGLGGLAVNSQNEIYVIDVGNYRVQKFDQNGKFLAKWGSQGTGPSQFDFPSRIDIDNQGQVYIWDKALKKFDRDGNFLGVLGTDLPQKEYLNGSAGLTLDNAGNVYVLGGDSSVDSARIIAFDSKGQFLKSVAIQSLDHSLISNLQNPAVDRQGNFYLNLNYLGLTDTTTPQLIKVEPAGDILSRWEINEKNTNRPAYSGIAFDSRNNIYELNRSEDRVEVFDSNGRSLHQFSIGWSRWLRDRYYVILITFSFVNLSLGIFANELKKKYGLLKTPGARASLITSAPTIAGKISQNLNFCATLPLLVMLVVILLNPSGLFSSWVNSNNSASGNTLLVLLLMLLSCALIIATFFVPKWPLMTGLFQITGGILIYILTAGIILQTLSIFAAIAGALTIASFFSKKEEIESAI
jgi:hypothetical protein